MSSEPETVLVVVLVQGPPCALSIRAYSDTGNQEKHDFEYSVQKVLWQDVAIHCGCNVSITRMEGCEHEHQARELVRREMEAT